jgi:hypothetical protein
LELLCAVQDFTVRYANAKHVMHSQIEPQEETRQAIHQENEISLVCVYVNSR